MIKGLKAGNEVAILLRDDEGSVYDTEVCMFISEVDGFIICSNFMYGCDTVKETLEHHCIGHTVDLYVVPVTDCFDTIEEANKAFEKETYQEIEFWR